MNELLKKIMKCCFISGMSQPGGICVFSKYGALSLARDTGFITWATIIHEIIHKYVLLGR